MTVSKFNRVCINTDSSGRRRVANRFSKRLVPLARQSAAMDDVAEDPKLLQRCESLERQLEERNIQLDILRTQLEKTNEEFQQFANAASHDLQTPLRSISGFSQFLQLEYQNELDDIANGYIDRVVDGAARIDQLLKGLIGYSRVTSKAAPFEMVNLNEAVEVALENLQFRISDSDATVTTAQLPTVFGDRKQLTLLFQNLIDNSLKFRNVSPPLIHIGVSQIAQEWNVSVTDNGIGIAYDRQECVFTIFRCLHVAQKHEGVGAGLAICRRILDLHSGRIWVESEKKQGCTFHFTIPLSSI